MKTKDLEINKEILLTLQAIKEELRTQKSEPELYTIAEAAEILKTDIATTRNYVEVGILPMIKIGRMKIRRISLLKFIELYEGYDITNPAEIKKAFTKRNQR